MAFLRDHRLVKKKDKDWHISVLLVVVAIEKRHVFMLQVSAGTDPCLRKTS